MDLLEEIKEWVLFPFLLSHNTQNRKHFTTGDILLLSFDNILIFFR